MQSSLPEEIQKKLKKILAGKAVRGGEFCLPFAPENFPLKIRDSFPQYRRFALEIGCGWGEFTRARAQQESDTLFIAIEKKLARVIASSRMQLQEGSGNIRYLVLDIAWFFEGIFAPGQFDEITINFPDPWPKARHHKHRFVSPDFAAILSTIACPSGRLTFATDNYLYAREAMQVFEASADWQNAVASYTALPQLAGRPQSFFEGVHRAEGATIYFLQYVKR